MQTSSELENRLKDQCKANQSAYLVEVGKRKISNAATYDHLWLKARYLYHEFRKLGLSRGDIVIDSSSGIEQMVHLLAAIMGNYIYIPVQARQIERLDQQNRDNPQADVRYLHSRDKSLGRLTWRDCFGSIPRLDSFQIGFLTSGSESAGGRWVFLSAAHLMHQLESHCLAMSYLGPGEDRLISLPQVHAFGLVLDRLLGLYSQQNLIFSPDARDMIAVIAGRIDALNPSIAAMVPRQTQFLVEALSAQEQLPSLKSLKIHTGGAPISARFRQFMQQHAELFIVGYGLTECGPGVLIDGKEVGCKIRLNQHDETTKLYELEVKTPSLGLMESPELSQDGYFKTKDLGVASDHGIDIIGRTSELIKNQSGEWLHISELREQIASLLSTEDFSLTLTHHPNGGAVCLRLLKSAGDLPPKNIERMRDMISKILNYKLEVWLPQDIHSLSATLYRRPQIAKGKSRDQLIANLPTEYFNKIA